LLGGWLVLPTSPWVALTNCGSLGRFGPSVWSESGQPFVDLDQMTVGVADERAYLAAPGGRCRLGQQLHAGGGELGAGAPAVWHLQDQDCGHSASIRSRGGDRDGGPVWRRLALPGDVQDGAIACDQSRIGRPLHLRREAQPLIEGHATGHVAYRDQRRHSGNLHPARIRAAAQTSLVRYKTKANTSGI